jgi:AhpD family alkylhydroperoxidase
VWETLKSVMTVEGAIDPLTREMIYIAVSTANACQYCIQSHTAAARSRGMTDAQYGELLTIIGLAAQTNHLALAMQVPPDPEFEVR